MNEHEFLLQDRIAKIKSINERFDLEHNAYLSFSGGKDSTVLHYLLDEALPDNRIPRVFINTGIEYKLITQFVKSLAEKDDRIVIWNVGKNISDTLKEVGYPFKSKEHSQKLYEYKKGYRSKSHLCYFRELPDGFAPCPKKLMYQKEPEFTLNISHKCCLEFKKNPAKEYAKQSKRSITITGMIKAERGQRTHINCAFIKNDKLQKFHPLAVVTKEFEDWYIESRKIRLCDLYYPPYNFTRTGCKGCPYSYNLREQLETLEKVLPEEKKQCELIWKPVYDEYRRIGYRLKGVK